MEGLSDILDSIANRALKDPTTKQHPIEIEVNKIIPSPFQPRRDFNEVEIKSLAASISQYGLINPITVRKQEGGDYFEIIAGERRWRAACSLGLGAIPVVIKKLSDQNAQAIALVENLQREDLNPIEEASGYQELLEKYGLTHDQVAESVGKPRSTISNFIRLLELDGSVRELLKKKSIEVGHAKLLVSLSSQVQMDLANKVVNGKLSVRQLEALIKRTVFAPTKTKTDRAIDERFNDIAVYLKRKLGEDFEVSISNTSKNKLVFSNEESLSKFMELLS